MVNICSTVPMALVGDGQAVVNGAGNDDSTLSLGSKKYSSIHAPLVKLGEMLSHRSGQRNRYPSDMYHIIGLNGWWWGQNLGRY